MYERNTNTELDIGIGSRKLGIQEKNEIEKSIIEHKLTEDDLQEDDDEGM